MSVGLTERFQLQDSIEVVAIAVIGGAGTVVGPILGALWIVGLPAVWPANDLVPLLTSSVGLLVLLMYFPGGFAQVVLAGRDRFLAWYAARLPEPEPSAEARGGQRGFPIRGRPCRHRAGAGRREGDGDIRRPDRSRQRLHPSPRRRGGGPHRHQWGGQNHADERHQRIRPELRSN